jgi:phosphoglycolate phosphatase-like HAD superfamily hydrolase
MGPKMLKVIALDFDGTLVESNSVKDGAFRKIFDEWPDHQQAMMSWHLNNNSIDRQGKFRYIVEEVLRLPGREDLINELVIRFGELTTKAVAECHPVRGAQEFLEYFHGKLPIYLLSATPQKELDEIMSLRKLNLFFEGVYGAPIDKASFLREIADKHFATVDEVLFIGDSPEDQLAADNANVQFVGRKSDRDFNQCNIPICRDMFEVKEYVIEKFSF